MDKLIIRVERDGMEPKQVAAEMVGTMLRKPISDFSDYCNRFEAPLLTAMTTLLKESKE